MANATYGTRGLHRRRTLHHVLDEWFEREAKPRLRGSCQLVRFADDFVMAFEDARSGRRMLDVLGNAPTS